MPLSPTIVVTAFSLCFGGAPADAAADPCAASVGDEQLARSVTGAGSTGSRTFLQRVAEDLGHDMLRQTRSAVGVAQDLWWSEKEGEIMAEAIHPVTARPAGTSLADLLSPQQTIVNSAGGTATITTDIRMGQISIDGVPL